MWFASTTESDSSPSMAYFDDSIGLNEISELHSGESIPEEEMEKSGKRSGLSRIPKLTFSFRRTPNASQTNKQPANSAPASNESSPTVSRSKSLRLPRSMVTSRAHSSSALDQNSDGESQASYLKPRTKDGSRSNPGSRSSSPKLSRRTFSSNVSSTGSEMVDSLSPDEATAQAFKKRSQSFSANTRMRTHARSTSLGNRENKISLGVRPSSAGRSKTPTGNSEAYSGRRPSSTIRKTPLVQTNFLENGSVNDAAEKPQSVSMIRTNSKDSVSSRRNSNGSTVSRGKRPSSVMVSNGAADLNKLAQEITTSFTPESDSCCDSSTSGLEVKSIIKPKTVVSNHVSRTKFQVSHHNSSGPTEQPARSKSPYDRGNSPSPTHKSISSTSSRLRDKHASIPSSSRARLRTPTKQYSTEREQTPQRPTSARQLYSFSQSSDQDRPKSATGARCKENPVSGSGSRSSSPSSGQSTPVSAVSHQTAPSRPYRGSASTSRLKDTPKATTLQSPSVDDVPSTSSRGYATGLPPRTPYRVARVRGVMSLVGEDIGINELQGSVLLEADDFRKIANDVKALKTVLLKLKREIQNDTNTPDPNGKTGHRNGSSVNDLSKGLEQITREKEKLQDEVSRQKKECRAKEAIVTQLTDELQLAKEEAKGLKDKLEQMEAHRDHLLDKVERLHADKHKLEARLTSLEKANFYEQTLSESTWLDELDADLECIEVGEGERKETESDIGETLLLSDGGEGENSEPESAAVCIAPQS